MKTPVKPKRKYVRKTKMTKPAEIEVKKPDHPEMPEAAENKMPFAVLEAVAMKLENDDVVNVGIIIPEPTDEEISDAAKRDAALDRITNVLVKIGIDEADLELALGIEPASVRKAKMPKKGNNGLSQDKKAAK
jgi:hypothetical protein